MSGKYDRPSVRTLIRDQRFQRLLIDRIEAGEGLVKDQQFRLMGDGRQQLNFLRHAFR